MAIVSVRNTGSSRLRLNGKDLKKILVGAGIAAAGSGIYYLLEYFQQVDAIDESNWWVPLAVSGLSVLANAARKLAKDYS